MLCSRVVTKIKRTKLKISVKWIQNKQNDFGFGGTVVLKSGLHILKASVFILVLLFLSQMHPLPARGKKGNSKSTIL